VSRGAEAFSAAFLARVRVSAAEVGALEENLRLVWDEAEVRWPGVVVAPDEIAGFLVERLTPDCDVLAELRRLHTSDLFLACGCARGDHGALAAFEQAFMPQVPQYLARGNAPADFIDDVKQQLRVHLFLAGDGRTGRISAYLGHGPLGAWLRMVALRLALDRDHAPGGPPDAYRFEAQALAPAIHDPELAYLKHHSMALVSRAVAASLTAMSPRDATLLDLFFLREVSQSALARMYHVSSRTVRRWLDEIRQKVVTEARRHLVEDLALPTAQADSLMRLFSSQVDMSIVRFLRRS